MERYIVGQKYKGKLWDVIEASSEEAAMAARPNATFSVYRVVDAPSDGGRRKGLIYAYCSKHCNVPNWGTNKTMADAVRAHKLYGHGEIIAAELVKS